MEERKIKKGDVVTIYNDYSHTTDKVVAETKVATSGKMWITTEYSRMKYSAETLRSEYMGHALFIGNEEECRAWLERREKVKMMARELSQYFSIGVPDFDFTEEVYSLYKEIKEEDGD